MKEIIIDDVMYQSFEEHNKLAERFPHLSALNGIAGSILNERGESEEIRQSGKKDKTYTEMERTS